VQPRVEVEATAGRKQGGRGRRRVKGKDHHVHGEAEDDRDRAPSELDVLLTEFAERRAFHGETSPLGEVIDERRVLVHQLGGLGLEQLDITVVALRSRVHLRRRVHGRQRAAALEQRRGAETQRVVGDAIERHRRLSIRRLHQTRSAALPAPV